MEHASSPKQPPPRPPKLAVLSPQLQLRHQRQILTPNSFSQPQRRLTPANQLHSTTIPLQSSASPAPKPPPECSMCGDVGLKKELFRCRKCSLRYQHTYCSNWYPKKRSYAGICNWCDPEWESHAYTGTSNAMTKRIKSRAASEVIAPLALIKKLAYAADRSCKIVKFNTEEHIDARTTTSTRNQQSPSRNQRVYKPGLCKSRQIIEPATSTMLAPKENVEGDCDIVRHNCADGSVSDEGNIKLVISDYIAASRIVERLQQRPAAKHYHKTPIRTSQSQYMSFAAATATSCNKKQRVATS